MNDYIGSVPIVTDLIVFQLQQNPYSIVFGGIKFRMVDGFGGNSHRSEHLHSFTFESILCLFG